MQNTAALCVIIPVYNSAATLTRLVLDVSTAIQDAGINGEIILVDDGSHDASWEMIVRIAAENTEVAGIRLHRNMGQHAATIAGLQAARAPACVTMDDDGQHPARYIPKLYAALSDGTDLVYAVPTQLKHSVLYYISTGIARGLISICCANRNLGRMQTYRLMRKDIYPWHTLPITHWLTIEGLLASRRVAIKRTNVEYEQSTRGVSTYGLLRLSKLVFKICLSGLLRRPLTCPSHYRQRAISATAGWL